MKKSIWWSLVFILLLLPGIVWAANDINWQDKAITADGFGAPPANAKNVAQARVMARRAAIVDAYRNIGEYAQGVQVDSETTVKDAMVENDTIRTKMSAVVKGAVIVNEQFNSDNSCQVTMQIPMFGANSIASAVLPENIAAEPFPQPSTPAALPPVTGSQPSIPVALPPATDPSRPMPGVAAGYSGLVIDCRGLELASVMSPVIYDANNRPIYGYKNLDYSKVISAGMTDYENSIDSHVRAGNNPLIVKAVSVQGYHHGNPVVSPADADAILTANMQSRFLDNLAVVFIVDPI